MYCAQDLILETVCCRERKCAFGAIIVSECVDKVKSPFKKPN